MEDRRQLLFLVVLGVFLLVLAGYAPLAARPEQPHLITPTVTASPTMCPQATPEPLWVEPVTSPTDLLTQTLTITLGNGEAITVTSPAGNFVVTAEAATLPRPATVEVALAPNMANPLLVAGRVRRVENAGCLYGGYTLTTDRDRLGNPLVIEQRSAHALYLPLLQRGE